MSHIPGITSTPRLGVANRITSSSTASVLASQVRGEVDTLKGSVWKLRQDLDGVVKDVETEQCRVDVFYDDVQSLELVAYGLQNDLKKEKSRTVDLHHTVQLRRRSRSKPRHLTSSASWTTSRGDCCQ